MLPHGPLREQTKELAALTEIARSIEQNYESLAAKTTLVLQDLMGNTSTDQSPGKPEWEEGLSLRGKT